MPHPPTLGIFDSGVGGLSVWREIVRQLRGVCGERQMPDVQVIQWGTAWGDSIIFGNGAA